MKMISVLAGMQWPAFPGPRAAQKLALLFQIEREQWRPSEDIAAAQLRQAKQVLAFAAETVPHYRASLGSAFDVRGIDAQSWHDLPILTRKQVHEAEMALRSQSIPAGHGRVHEISTSGSTGMVVKVLGTDLTQLFWQVFTLRDHLWHRRDFSQKLVAIRYQRSPEDQKKEGRRSPGWGPATDDVVRTGESMQFDIRLDVPWLVEQLVAEQPGYLLTHPSMLAGLAKHCREHKLDIPGLREVRIMGETPAEDLRGICREAWGVPLIDMYSCQEAGYLALQCPDHEHLHVQSENVLLEVVDADGRPCQPGDVGRVLVTSLNNFATPLIRYEIGDCAEVGGSCACGRGLPVLKRVMGRYRNMLTMPDGTQHWPLLGYEGRLRYIAPIETLQMVQTSPDEIIVRLVMPRTLAAAEAEALAEYLRENLRYPFRLSFEYVDSIRNPTNGKIEQFISRVDRTTWNGMRQ